MFCIVLVVLLLGVLLLGISMGAIILIDPIICILAIIGLYKLVKHFTEK